MNETTKLSLRGPHNLPSKLKGGEQTTHIYDFDIVGGGGRGDNTYSVFGLKDVRLTTFTKSAERVETKLTLVLYVSQMVSSMTSDTKC